MISVDTKRHLTQHQKDRSSTLALSAQQLVPATPVGYFWTLHVPPCRFFVHQCSLYTPSSDYPFVVPTSVAFKSPISSLMIDCLFPVGQSAPLHFAGANGCVHFCAPLTCSRGCVVYVLWPSSARSTYPSCRRLTRAAGVKAGDFVMIIIINIA